jgi:hypothetical protein
MTETRLQLALIAMLLACGACSAASRAREGTPLPPPAPRAPNVVRGEFRALVIDDSTGQPLEGVRIRQDTTNTTIWGATTGIDGFARAEGIRGTWRVRIYAEGYPVLFDTVTVDSTVGHSALYRLKRPPRARSNYIDPDPQATCPQPAEMPGPVFYCALMVKPVLDTQGLAQRVDSLDRLLPRQYGAWQGSCLVVQLFIDTTGRVRERSGVQIARSCGRSDTLALFDIVRRFRFTPGRLVGGPVESRFYVQFDVDSWPPDTPSGSVLHLRTSARGIGIHKDYEPLVRLAPPPVYSAADLASMRRAALRATMREPGPLMMTDSGRVICTGSRSPGGPAEATEADLRDAFPDRTIVAGPQCPRTYQTMFAQFDSPGNVIRRPPGYLDPARIGFAALVPWTKGTARLEVRIARGSGGYDYRCALYAPTRGEREWTAFCRSFRSWVS